MRNWLGAVLIPSFLPLLAVAVLLVWTPYAFAWTMTGLILSPILVAFAIVLPIHRWRGITRSHRDARVKSLWFYLLAVVLNLLILAASWFMAIWMFSRQFANF